MNEITTGALRKTGLLKGNDRLWLQPIGLALRLTVVEGLGLLRVHPQQCTTLHGICTAVTPVFQRRYMIELPGELCLLLLCPTISSTQ